MSRLYQEHDTKLRKYRKDRMTKYGQYRDSIDRDSIYSGWGGRNFSIGSFMEQIFIIRPFTNRADFENRADFDDRADFDNRADF